MPVTIDDLVASTTALTLAVNTSKATLDAKVTVATAQAGIATTQAETATTKAATATTQAATATAQAEIATNAAATLTYAGTGAVAGSLVASAAGTAASPIITMGGDTNTGLFFPGGDNLGVATGGVQRVNYNSDGMQVLGTAAINIPTGTTAQRPTPANGMIRMNSDYGRPEYYSSLLSMWLPFSGGGATPNIGDPFGGGFFAGYISAAGNGIASHMLIVAPKAAGESVLAWDTTAGGSATGFTSVIDGPANSAGLAALGTRYAAATWCEGLSIGGYTDWYLPAKNELEVAYHNLKNVSQDNYAPGSYGSNPNAVPPLEPVSTPYTATRPAQTTVAAFKVGNSEAFADDFFWSSTEYSAPYAWFQGFCSGNPGYQDDDTEPNGYYVRAFRRLLI